MVSPGTTDLGALTLLLPAPPQARDVPLTAAYCAERAAAAIRLAADVVAPAFPNPSPTPTEQYLAIAAAWRDLGQAMVQHPTMRPRNDDDDEPRR